MASFQTPRPIMLSIELGQGLVHVIAADRTDTVVAVNPTDRDRAQDDETAQKTLVDLTGGTLSIRAPRPPGIRGYLGMAKGGSVDVTVELPAGSSLRAEVGYGELRCDGRLDDVEIRSGAGGVRLDQTAALRVRCGAGPVSVEAVLGVAEIVSAGDMTIGAVAGKADIKNLNGKTWIGSVGGDVTVRSANGDVTIEDAGRNVSVKTANGNVRLGQVARGAVSVETASGGLEIGIREGTAAWIDASTHFGRVDNTLPPSQSPDRGTDIVEVSARTAFGDVLITRSPTSSQEGAS
ncbi:MAG TPA: DUF4097 family beta strand repeat-containing protein [Acidimicrobiia bacterium]|jgi:hypothetical protein|nr:DUF4097 family beta strand repeat-containing protein [Acidimicrobiia bacterium]